MYNFFFCFYAPKTLVQGNANANKPTAISPMITTPKEIVSLDFTFLLTMVISTAAISIENGCSTYWNLNAAFFITSPMFNPLVKLVINMMIPNKN